MAGYSLQGYNDMTGGRYSNYQAGALVPSPGGSMASAGVQTIPVDVNVPGGGKGAGFGEFLNSLRGGAKQAAGLLGAGMQLPGVGVAAPIAYGAGSLMQGELAQGAGEIGGGLLGAKLSGGLAKSAETALGAMGSKGKLAAPIVGGAIRIAGGLLGGGIGGGVANAVGGGVANAANAITGGAARTQMTAGTSPGAIPGIGGTGIGFSNDDIAKIEQISKITGRSQIDVAKEMLPIQNQYLDNQMQRQMQLNQQTGQLTGALNRQAYTAQLAGGAQAQGGETVRAMMNAGNPYAQSAFQYRG
jgi:hypothetical protein